MILQFKYKDKILDVLLDDEDYHLISESGLSWKINNEGYQLVPLYYLVGRKMIKTKRRSTRLHRVIMNAPEGMVVDHINGNSLDNRKLNLRLCTETENKRNSPRHKNSKSAYKGVHWHKLCSKWIAHIGHNGKSIHLGYFTDPKLAAEAYNKKALELQGKFARLNVIED